jgi:hypothetical protein
MHYPAKWYVERGAELLVDRARQIVMVKFSSQTLPLDGDAIRMTYRAMDAIQALLVLD